MTNIKLKVSKIVIIDFDSWLTIIIIPFSLPVESTRQAYK